MTRKSWYIKKLCDKIEKLLENNARSFFPRSACLLEFETSSMNDETLA